MNTCSINTCEFNKTSEKKKAIQNFFLKNPKGKWHVSQYILHQEKQLIYVFSSNSHKTTIKVSPF